MTSDLRKSRAAGVALALVLGLGLPAAARAAEPAPDLTPGQISSASTLDQLTVPSPGELFAALGKQTKPNWSSEFRGPLGAAFKDRAQVALNLGGLVADGYISVEAMDGQQVKNLGRDIIGLARVLGISNDILARGSSITQFADNNDWNALKEELEATQNEAKQAMDALHDEELVTLVSLGGWIRGTQVVSSIVLKNFTPQNAAILRQPQLVGFLRAKLGGLSAPLKEKPLIKSIEEGLAGIETLVSFPLGGAASKEDVQKLHDKATELIKLIVTK